MERHTNSRSMILTLPETTEIQNPVLSDFSDEYLRHYIDHEIQCLGQNPICIPNNWIVQIRFNDPYNLKNGTSSFMDILTTGLNNGAITHVIPLFDAWFCRMKNLDPLEKNIRFTTLCRNEDYLYGVIAAHRNGTDAHTLRGIRTDKGLHVFSSDKTGIEALKNCLHYYETHFFEKENSTTLLEIVSVRTLDMNPVPSGNKFAEIGDLKNSPQQLPQGFYSKDKDLVKLGIREFDMIPTLENYRNFTIQNGIDVLDYSQRNYNFINLRMARMGLVGSEDDFIGGYFNRFHTYAGSFCDLFDRVEKYANQEDFNNALEEIRVTAGKIIDKDFSDMHCYESPQIKEKLSPQQIDDEYAETQKRRGIKM